ncbi:hemin uptake protein HemP [Thiocystis violascens]|uniref:Hemin uptake protein n=1 Tax=Thiocystis violascens (strain ATCC 17096 / DSM 198 / 6111) TaxID=765911 RepID=I3YG71_THIV6|nr:hemin uptake protein HemP [Thiocystis violascens]AFL75989.1 hemin uptake protein [Thiocystis violascens DSM 198]
MPSAAAPDRHHAAQLPSRLPLPSIPRIASQALLEGGNLVMIEHAGVSYFLRMTRNNKLILTK